MLLYNHNKEFLGIDDDDLRLLGYQSFSELLSECHDFADLFVKKPGYIHNFKNFQWIDFVLHAEAEESKAIVHAKGRNFSCQIVIKNLYLSSAPSEEAYVIELKHIAPLSSAEDAEVTQNLVQNPIATPTTPFNPPEVEPQAPSYDDALPAQEKETITEDEPSLITDVADNFPNFDDVETTALSEPDTFDIPDSNPIPFDPYDSEQSQSIEKEYADFSKPLEIEDDLFMAPETSEVEADDNEVLPDLDSTLDEVVPEEEPEQMPMLGDYISQDKEYLDKHQVDTNYVYNPQVAADELGLPVDLIEEFIGDFIAQSHDFHDELFESSAKEDFDNVKILSHKLKGVAANLRIEDAFEMLSIINTSEDAAEIEANLRAYYRIVAHLEGKELEEAPVATPAVEETTPEVNFDNDLLSVEESFMQEESTAEAADEETLPPLDKTPIEDLYELDVKMDETPAENRPMEEIDDDLYDIGIKQDDDAPLMVMDPIEDDVLNDLEPLTIDDAPIAPLDEAPTDAPETTPQPEVVEETTVPLQYDATAAANELGLDPKLVQGIITDFADEARLKRDSFDDALIANNAHTWQEVARELKGVTDNLRMNDLSTSLQDIIKADNAEDAAPAVNQFFNYVNQL